jgi:hypothetical protein
MSRAPVFSDRVVVFVASCGSVGAVRGEIRAAMGCTNPNGYISSRLPELVRAGRLFQVGPDKWRRYFSREDMANDYAARSEETIARLREEGKASTRAKQSAARQARRLRERAARAPKVEPKVANPATPWRNESPTKRATVKQAHVEIVGLDRAHVVVGRAWTHDPRYQLPLGERVVGGFATMGIGRYLESA